MRLYHRTQIHSGQLRSDSVCHRGRCWQTGAADMVDKREPPAEHNSSLCAIDTINVCDGDATRINGPPYENAENCSTASILNTSESSLQFVLPSAGGNGKPRRRVFQICNPYAAGGQPCSQYYSLNLPSLWWAQGDASSSEQAVATAGGWLRLYGRSLGWTTAGECAAGTTDRPSPAVGTTAELLAAHPKQNRPEGEPVQLLTTEASCYHAVMSVPATTPAGRYTLSVPSSLGVVHKLATITVMPTRPWATTTIPVAVGSSVSTAVAEANAIAGGAVVALASGVHEMSNNETLKLSDNVLLTSATPSAHATLRWGANVGVGPLASLIGATADIGNTGRYAIENLTIAVDSPCLFVIDVSGHGTVVRGVTVTMPHTLANSGSVISTSGTGFSVTGNNFTHDNHDCKTYGYPRDCLLFFQPGTNGGLVAQNQFQMGCCAFAGYAAQGVVLENNTFTDLKDSSQPDGNGFASFGSPRVSERISWSRNTCEIVLTPSWHHTS